MSLDLIECPLVRRVALGLRNELVDLDLNGFGVHQVFERRADIGGEQQFSAMQPVLVVVVYIAPTRGDLRPESGAQGCDLESVDDADRESTAEQRSFHESDAFGREDRLEGAGVIAVERWGGRAEDAFDHAEAGDARWIGGSGRGYGRGPLLDEDNLAGTRVGRDGARRDARGKFTLAQPT